MFYNTDADADDCVQALHLPDTLIPDEYHIVKNRGVMGIEYHEEWVSVLLVSSLGTTRKDS